MIVGCGRSVGRQRENNEDALFAFTAILDGEGESRPFGIYIVADGMGGHEYGQEASDVAVRAMSSHMMEKIYTPLFSVKPEMPFEPLQEIMEEGVMEANQAVLRGAPGGGTTLTAILIIGKQMTIAHVGDSRAYGIYLDGRIQTLTRDHSLVKRLEELGQITSEEAELHPQKHVLYRALGQGEPFKPDIHTSPIPHPGYLLICSDGLWGVIEEDELFRLVTSAPSPQRACAHMIEAANAAGGPDNITAILIRMPE